MKKKWYQSSLTKTLLILLEHLSVIGFCLCALSLILLIDKGIYPNDLLKKNFEETDTFRYAFQDEMYNVLEGLTDTGQYQKLMENPEKTIIDLDFSAQYNEHNPYFGNKSGLAYKVSDLLAWAEEGIETPYDFTPAPYSDYKDQANDNWKSRIIVCQRPDGTYDYITLEEFEDSLEDGSLVPVMGEYSSRAQADFIRYELPYMKENNSYYCMADFDITALTSKNTIKYVDFWTYSGEALVEKYAPVGYKSILELVQKNKYWNGRMQDAYTYLSGMLRRISALQSSVSFEQLYAPEKTNIRYILLDRQSGEITSNDPAVTNNHAPISLSEASSTDNNSQQKSADTEPSAAVTNQHKIAGTEPSAAITNQHKITDTEPSAAITNQHKITGTEPSAAITNQHKITDTEPSSTESSQQKITDIDLQEIVDQICTNSTYAIVTQNYAECESNGSFELGYLHNISTTLIPLEDYQFILYVPKDYPVMDTLGRRAADFARYSPYFGLLFAGLILCLLLFAAGLIWLTLVAGHVNSEEDPAGANAAPEALPGASPAGSSLTDASLSPAIIAAQKNHGISLLRFDYWFTELAAGLILTIWFIGLAVFCESVPYVENNTESCIAVLLMAIFTVPLFLFGYLSLVRRIKAGILWKNSLLRWLCRMLWKLLLAMKSFFLLCLSYLSDSLKAGLAISAFLIFHLLGYAFTFNEEAAFLLVIFVVDLAALIFGIYRVIGWSKIRQSIHRIADGEINHQVSLEHLGPDQKDIAATVNRIGGGLDAAVAASLKNERTKTELITNVSHDIKTPLTSILNYVDLLSRENFEDEKVRGYLKIIDSKAHQLKVLTEDIVEASKASAGSLIMDMADLNFIEMISQVMGEFQEKYEAKTLTMVPSFPEEAVIIHADGARMWRVLENIFGNVEKYALPGTRVYIDLKTVPLPADKSIAVSGTNYESGPLTTSRTEKTHAAASSQVILSLKNISAQPLNISADELTERFIRGDISRNTEGSGLGLSIAKSLVELQHGSFQLYLDGDLFKVEITMACRIQDSGPDVV